MVNKEGNNSQGGSFYTTCPSRISLSTQYPLGRPTYHQIIPLIPNRFPQSHTIYVTHFVSAPPPSSSPYFWLMSYFHRVSLSLAYRQFHLLKRVIFIRERLGDDDYIQIISYQSYSNTYSMKYLLRWFLFYLESVCHATMDLKQKLHTSNLLEFHIYSSPWTFYTRTQVGFKEANVIVYNHIQSSWICYRPHLDT